MSDFSGFDSLFKLKLCFFSCLFLGRVNEVVFVDLGHLPNGTSGGLSWFLVCTWHDNDAEVLRGYRNSSVPRLRIDFSLYFLQAVNLKELEIGAHRESARRSISPNF